jgi:hypothetical protein
MMIIATCARSAAPTASPQRIEFFVIEGVCPVTVGRMYKRDTKSDAVSAERAASV